MVHSGVLYIVCKVNNKHNTSKDNLHLMWTLTGPRISYELKPWYKGKSCLVTPFTRVGVLCFMCTIHPWDVGVDFVEPFDLSLEVQLGVVHFVLIPTFKYDLNI